MVKHAKLDVECPNCKKTWTILLNKKELKKLLKQTKTIPWLPPPSRRKKNVST